MEESGDSEDMIVVGKYAACGPTALAAVANRSTDEALVALTNWRGAAIRKNTWWVELCGVLRRWNVSYKRCNDTYGTLRKWLWRHPTGRYLIRSGWHFYAVQDGQVLDQRHGRILREPKARECRKRVSHALRLVSGWTASTPVGFCLCGGRWRL